MGVLLSVYSQEAYKEYLLPSYHNGEERLNLRKNLFGLKEDILLDLEVVNDSWRFTGANAAVEINGESCLGKELHFQDSIIVTDKENKRLYIIFRVKDSFFEAYRKFKLTGKNQIVIGSELDRDISYSFVYESKQYVSKTHAILRKTEKGWEVESKGPNGSFLNNCRIRNSSVLKYGDHINIWGMDIVFLGDMLGINTSSDLTGTSIKLERWEDEEQGEAELSDKKPTFIYHRYPRNIEPLNTENIEIEGPPTPKEKNDTPILMQIGPALTMMFPMLLGSGLAILSSRISGNAGSGFMYTGLVTAGCSGILGAFWAVNNIKYAEKKRRQEETRRFDTYSQYLIQSTEKIKKSYNHNRQILFERYLSAEEILSNEGDVPRNLWGRNQNHGDFLYYRLGIGDIPFQVQITIPKEHFSMVEDSLAEKPGLIKENFKTLKAVPVGIDLMKHTLLGIAGGENKKGADSILFNLVTQIATQNCYTDVKLVFLSKSEEYSERWNFALWLPHVWSESRKFRFTAFNKTDAGEVIFELTEILRRRFEQQGNGDIENQKNFLPYYIFFVEDEDLISGELIEKYIYCQEKKLGLTTVFLAEHYEDLPNSCECIIQNDENFRGICNVKTGEAGKQEIQFDSIEQEQVNILARKMSPMRVNEREIGGEIPSSISFFELYGISSPEELKAEERWRRNRVFESIKALIGVKSGGEPCYLDLHEKYHGPHGLIAGTTGSGKSETIQTYILSLALNFSPDDVGFFIIDYKGGGMGNLFADLPHVLGQISNLSGNQIQRALISIKSENLRRQRLFNENGVNNINSYTRLYKNGEVKIPIPHLFIIIDEFAELKREEPEFMRELISVAQVGRSLGVHLILATQKPAGTVDDNIWSNAKFRLCLRVQDRQDSIDMLHRPDAAYLTGAGRGYLQVGNDEIYELFQSGWSGAEYDEEMGTNEQILATMLTVSGKTAIVGNYERSRKRAEARIRWLNGLIREWNQILNTYCRDKSSPYRENIEEEIEILQRRLTDIGEDHLNNEHGKRLLKNLILLCKEAKENGKEGDLHWIVERAEEKHWNLPEKKRRTQLNAVIDYLQLTVKKEGYRSQEPLWLPVLPARIGIKQVWGMTQGMFFESFWPEYNGKIALKAEVGLCDDPVNRVQEPLILNFTEDGNHAVCGLPMSGKSTFLQTAVYSLLKKYSPQYLNVYILDFSSRMLEPFEKAPQVGGILYENDLDNIGKLFHMLEKRLKERKKLFRGGNFSQYTAKHGPVCPAILVVIDHMAAFREKTSAEYDDILLRFSRECASNGIYLLISGASYGISEIPSRLKDNIRKNICMELQDKYQYADIFNTVKIDTVPESGIPGRGLVKTDDGILEFQTCLASEVQDDYSRLEEIQEECRRMDQNWMGKRAKSIPVIPEKPVWLNFVKWDEVEADFQDKRKLPIGYVYETAEPYNIDLRNMYCFIISGRARTGKTNLLKIAMRSAARKKAELVVIEFEGEELKAEAEDLGARYIATCEDYFQLMMGLFPEIKERNTEKKRMLQQMADKEELFDQLSEKKPYFLFISDLAQFSQIMHGKEGEERGCAGFTSNFFEKGDSQNVYFIACMNPDKRLAVQNQKVYQTFTDWKTGIHLGGNCDGQTYLDFSKLSYNQLKEALPAGQGYVSMLQEEGATRIVVPQAKG